MPDSGSRFAYATRDVRVVLAAGAIGDVARELDGLGLTRVMLVSTPGRARDVERLREALGGRIAGEFAQAAQHVPVETVRAAVRSMAGATPDACVALGGGSAIGLGKALARETGLPLVAIPTTYSGSEMTAIWGMSEGGEKRTGRDPRVAPRLVIYDPELTLDLPASVSAASGMNAVAHAIEAMYAADASPVSSLFAEDALRRLARSLPMVIRALRDLASRTEALTGAHLAGRALDLTSMGLHHRLCHILGGFGMPHAETHAALLPHVVAYNEAAAPEAMRAIAAALDAHNATDGIVALSQRLGTARPLGDIGMTNDMATRAAEVATAGTFLNPAPVTRDAVERMLLHARTSALPMGG